MYYRVDIFSKLGVLELAAIVRDQDQAAKLANGRSCNYAAMATEEQYYAAENLELLREHNIPLGMLIADDGRSHPLEGDFARWSSLVSYDPKLDDPANVDDLFEPGPGVRAARDAYHRLGFEDGYDRGVCAGRTDIPSPLQVYHRIEMFEVHDGTIGTNENIDTITHHATVHSLNQAVRLANGRRWQTVGIGSFEEYHSPSNLVAIGVNSDNDESGVTPPAKRGVLPPKFHPWLAGSLGIGKTSTVPAYVSEAKRRTEAWTKEQRGKLWDEAADKVITDWIANRYETDDVPASNEPHVLSYHQGHKVGFKEGFSNGRHLGMREGREAGSLATDDEFIERGHIKAWNTGHREGFEDGYERMPVPTDERDYTGTVAWNMGHHTGYHYARKSIYTNAHREGFEDGYERGMAVTVTGSGPIEVALRASVHANGKREGFEAGHKMGKTVHPKVVSERSAHAAGRHEGYQAGFRAGSQSTPKPPKPINPPGHGDTPDGIRYRDLHEAVKAAVSMVNCVAEDVLPPEPAVPSPDQIMLSAIWLLNIVAADH